MLCRSLSYINECKGYWEKLINEAVRETITDYFRIIFHMHLTHYTRAVGAYGLDAQ